MAWAYRRDVVYRTGNFGSAKWRPAIWQSVLDRWTIQETIAEIKPAPLVGTGTCKRGSALI